MGPSFGPTPLTVGKGDEPCVPASSGARTNRPGEILVTADADGQHLPQDIFRAGVRAESLAASWTAGHRPGRTPTGDPIPDAGEEGTRVPLRSKVGNSATVGFFALATGAHVADTQTGLRAFTPQILDWLLQIPGDKYEYEFSMLLRATRAEMELVQVPIVKVYEPGNPTSHFRSLRTRPVFTRRCCSSWRPSFP